MKRKHLYAAALLLCSAVASAQTRVWNYNYVGFYHLEQNAFLSDLGLGGQFSGEDRNRDNVIDLSELDFLKVGSWDSRQCAAGDANCGLERFSFAFGSALDFAMHATFSDPASSSGGSLTVSTGDLYREVGYVPRMSWDDHYYWTPETRFYLAEAPPPVPEPGRYALLAAGLFALAGLRRRR